MPVSRHNLILKVIYSTDQKADRGLAERFPRCATHTNNNLVIFMWTFRHRLGDGMLPSEGMAASISILDCLRREGNEGESQ